MIHVPFIGRILVLSAVLLAFSPLSVAVESVSLEYRVKAAFLFYFANFVQWPDSAFADSEAPVQLCVLGEDPFGPVLDQVVEKKKVNGRPISVLRGLDLEAFGACHILFISQSEQSRLRRIIQGVSGQHVLTVYESSDFTHQGGSISFVLEERKVRFEINLKPVNEAGLTISSKLLKVARRVIMP